MIRLLRTADHGWYISRVIDTHNHAMSVGYDENRQWNSHNIIDPGTKMLVQTLRENNISIGRVCSILNGSVSSPVSQIRKESIRSLCARISRDNMQDDMGKTLKLLDDMKKNDPMMQVRFSVDNLGTLKSMLWCSGKNTRDYKQFGDAVTFDTTYRTNLYSLPFGLFVGVNNHFQSTIFGGLLLTSERTEDFEWAFDQFMGIMDGNPPTTILTGNLYYMEKLTRSGEKREQYTAHILLVCIYHYMHMSSIFCQIV